MGTVALESLWKPRWNKVKGLALTPLDFQRFVEIGELCGGVADVDPCLSNLEDLQWVRLKLRPCDPGSIHRVGL